MITTRKTKTSAAVFIAFFIVIMVSKHALATTDIVLVFDSNSYFAVDFNFDLAFDVSERTPITLGPDGGLLIGSTQTASGSHSGPPDGSESPGIDMPWTVFGNTGMHLTTSPVTFLDNTSLDFSGWAAIWGDDPTPIPIGAPADFPSDTQIASISCTSNPCQGADAFILDYLGHVPLSNPFWGGQFYSLHLEGSIGGVPAITILGDDPLTHEIGPFTDPGATAADYEDGDLTASLAVTSTVDPNVVGSYTIDYNVTDSDGYAAITRTRIVNVVAAAPPVLVNNAGVSSVRGQSVTITTTELQYDDAVQPPASVAYLVTTPPVQGQLELSGSPGIPVSSFTQDDIDNNRVLYVNGGGLANDDSFMFDVHDGLGNVLTGNSFAITINDGVDLQVTIDDVPFLILAEDQERHTINVTNAGHNDASDVTLTVILPEDSIYVGMNPQDWDCNVFTLTIICSQSTLSAGASTFINIDFTIPTQTRRNVTNVSVASAEQDSNSTDNTVAQESLGVNFTEGGFSENGYFPEDAADDHSGSVLAMTETWLAVGIPDDDYQCSEPDCIPATTIVDAGRVDVYRRQFNGWVLDQQLVATDVVTAGTNMRFGTALALDANTLVIGTSDERAYVFSYDGNDWSEQAILTASDSAPGDEFGYSVATNGAWAAIGAPGGAAEQGKVYLFNFDGTSWSESTIVVPFGDFASSTYRFGHAVAMSEDTLVTGAPGRDPSSDIGHAFTHRLTSGVWNPEGELNITSGNFADRYGRAVAIDGDTAVVGAQYNVDGGLESGAAHVFRRYGSFWSYQQKLTATDAVGLEEFGWSVAIQDETILVGAPGARTAETTGTQAGSTYIFQLVGNTWLQQQKRSLSFGAIDDQFGAAVAIAEDSIAVGAPFDDLDMETDAGSISIFTVKPANSSNIKFTSATPGTGDRFGMAVDIGNGTIAVGAPHDDDGCTSDCGSVHIYSLTGSNWVEEAKLDGSSFGVGDQGLFGFALAVHGDTLAVGAYQDDANGTDSGAVYIFTRSGGTWSLQTQLQPDSANEFFGYALDIDYEPLTDLYTILIGAPGGDSAYIYEGKGSNWNRTQKLLGSYISFGYAVSVRGDSLVVGAPSSDVAEVYTNSGSGWFHEQTLTPGDDDFGNASFGNFGASVAIDRRTPAGGLNGILVVGVPDGENGYSFNLDGTAYVYLYEFAAGGPKWDYAIRAEGLIPNFTTQGGDQFGRSISLYGDNGLFGSPHSGQFSSSGKAYRDSLNGSGKITFTAFDAEADDQFGYAVALDLDASVVGAPFEDGSLFQSNYGAVYVFPTGTQSSLSGGFFNTPQTVTLSCLNCVAIWYTLDGSDPSDASNPNRQQYSSPIDLNVTQTLKYTSEDSGGAFEFLKTEQYVFDNEVPNVTAVSLEDNQSPETGTIALPETGTTIIDDVSAITGSAVDTGGAGVSLVQLEIQDLSTTSNFKYVDLETDGSFNGLSDQPKWLVASGTDSWTLNTSNVVFESEHDYRVRIRVFDSVGNVSSIITRQFTYYTGTPAFTTLGLTLSSSSILNSASGGSTDVTMNLEEPGTPDPQLAGLNIDLVITPPSGVSNQVTFTCTTDNLGVAQMDDLGLGGAGGPYPDCFQTAGNAFAGFDEPGTWTLQARFNADGSDFTRQPADSPARTLTVGSAAGFAVIIQGRQSGDEGIEAHNKTANRIYQTLVEDRGFQPDDIWYFNPDTNQDDQLTVLDGSTDCEPIHSGDGCNDWDPIAMANTGPANGIDGTPDKTVIAGVFTEPASTTGSLAERMSQRPAPLYVILIDHGSPDIFYLDPDASGADQTISPTDLHAWLAALEGELDIANGGLAASEPMIPVLGMCYSGSFIDELSDPAHTDRYIIASADPTELSYRGALENDGIRVGEYFLEEFFQQAGRGFDLAESFSYAAAVTETFTRRDSNSPAQGQYNDTAVQHPLVDTNGDDVGSNELREPTGSEPNPDGLVLQGLFLGVGPTILVNSPDSPADITSVTPTRFLPSGVNSTILQLTANDDQEVEQAWIEVRAPTVEYLTQTGTVQVDPGVNDGNEGLVRQQLLSPANCQAAYGLVGVWCTSYNNFTTSATSGKSEVFYFVQDVGNVAAGIEGGVSPAQRSVVYRNTGSNTAPAAFNLLAPDDGASERTALAFDWGSSSDADGLTYTLEIATDSAFAGIVHRQEELAVSHTTVDESAGLADLTTYYWRVIAVDSFGAQTLGTDAATTNRYRSFSTDNTNARRGFVYTTVRDAVSFVPLDGATVTVTPDPGANCGTSGTDPCVEVYEEAGEYTVVVEPAISTAPDGLYTVNASLTGYDPNAESGVNANISPDIVIDLSAPDTDGDGLGNAFELSIGTDPNLRDTDGDGLDDDVEVGFDENLGDYDPYHPTINPGGTDLDANSTDTDGDGIDDQTEFLNTTGSEPIDPTGYPNLADGDVAPLLAPLDGNVNAADVLVAQRMALGQLTASVRELAHGDMNCDGQITLPDVLLIQRMALGETVTTTCP